MKYVIIIIITCFFLQSCIKEGKKVTYTFDATKDTTFVVERHGDGPSIILNIDGYLSDSTMISVISDDPIILDSGNVHLQDKRLDFYDNQATVSFKHLNNKKGKLKISARF